MDVEAISNMERYIKDVLEERQEAFGGLPLCPFARAERVTGKIRYEFCELLPAGPTGDVEKLVREFKTDREHSTLLIVDPVRRMNKAEGLQYGIAMCERVRDAGIVTICLHPDDEFEVAGFKPRSPIPYITLIAQSGHLILEAKKILARTNYYRNWTATDLAFNFLQIGRFLKV